MTNTPKPQGKPARPYFSSGPCAKPPAWTPEKLDTRVMGRSHRSKLGKARLQHAIDLTREILGVPEGYRIGIVPASDTGAVEMCLWSMLGARKATMVAWESFGEGWVTDVVKQLKIEADVVKAPYGEIPDLAVLDQDTDIVLTWNGTTSGARVPNGDWIKDDREGLIIADSTSAVFAMDMPWAKLDVVTFSWQKVMGGEGAHGVIILSPRAVERLETYTPTWPMPKIFRMTKGGKLIEGIFKGETINTPSMLAVEDAILGLEWAQDIGGLPALIERTNANAAALQAIVAERDWLGNLAKDEASRSTTSVCLTVEGADEAMIKKMASLLEAEDAAYDVAGYRDAPAGLRIWCGATVDTADIVALGPWLDWAYAEAKAAVAAA